MMCSRDRNHPSLHSFPTRRSSDLPGAARGRRCGSADHQRRGAGAQSAAGREVGREDEDGRRVADDQRTRSEEHTSELQSPCKLVCRLLLEKKKKKVSLSKATN